MLVLVATTESQGSVEGDFCWALEGELVVPALQVCCSPEQCGCGRAFQGLGSHRATTTARVVELDLDEATWASLMRAEMVASLGEGADEDEELWEIVHHGRAAADCFGVGVVVGYDGEVVWRRAFTVTPPS